MQPLAPATERRKSYQQRLKALESERSSWWEHWLDIAKHIHPRRFRSSPSERNSGTKKNGSIINGTATRAVRTLASGMMSGITSPARPWFKLTTDDAGAQAEGEVRAWLDEVEARMRSTFARSNTYNVLASVYRDLPTIGTAPVFIDEDDEDVIRLYPQVPGSYCLANSARLSVDTLYRVFGMSAAQLVEAFGAKACSEWVRAAADVAPDKWFEVLHVVTPNTDFERGALGVRGKAYLSCWMELGQQEAGFLREAGFEECPFLAPRWDVVGEDVYGCSPAMDALGDVRALQFYELETAKLVAKISDPPMTGPSGLSAQQASLLPGSLTVTDERGQGSGYRPAMEVQPQAIGVVAEEKRQHEARINSAFFADLWLMVASDTGGQKTAREVAELHEEKMLQLGPVLERLHDELLEPLIRRTYGIMLRRGLLPEVPEALQGGAGLRVDYISIMAQAQKLLGTTSIERGVSFVGNLAAVREDVLDNVDFDEVTRSYFDMLGVPARMLRSPDAVAQARAARAEASQQAQAMEQAQQGADAAATLAATDMQGDTALTRLMSSMGVAPPAGLAGAA